MAKNNRIQYNDEWSVDFKKKILIRLKDNRIFPFKKRGFGVQVSSPPVPVYIKNFLNTVVSREVTKTRNK